MVILAIPTIRAINRVIKACGDCTRTYSLDEEQSEDKKDQKTKGKYKAVSYTPPSPTEHENTTFDLKTINSMTRNQEKLDNKIKFLEKDRESKNDE